MEKLNELVELVKEYNSATTAEEALAINNQFKATANRENILAIAEAFRALEQRAEAAEANSQEAAKTIGTLAARVQKAEAKLAWMYKQKPIGKVDRGAATDSNEYPDARVVCLHEHVGWEAFQDGCELFTRPASAADLSELVPEQALNGQARFLGDKEPYYNRGWNDCRAAILSKIEQAK